MTFKDGKRTEKYLVVENLHLALEYYYDELSIIIVY